MKQKWVLISFFGLVCATLLASFVVVGNLMYPYMTGRAFFLRITVELALPFYIYLVLANRNLRPRFNHPLTIAVLVFLVVNLVSAIFGVDFIHSFWGNLERMSGVYYLIHLTLLYFYLLLLAQAGGKFLKWFLQAVIASGSLAALYGVLAWFNILHFLPIDSYRASSTFGNPIFFASFLILPTFITAFFALEAESLGKKIWYWFLVALQIYAVFLSGTRGAMVGLVGGVVVAAIVYISLSKHRIAKISGWAGLATMMAVVAIAFVSFRHLSETSVLYRMFNLSDSNAKARLIQWKIALGGFKDHPLLGVGPENYFIVADKYYQPQIYQYDPNWFDRPHNYALEVLITTGSIGLLAYLTMVALAAWGLWRALRANFLSLLEMCLLFCGLAVYFIQNLFVFDTVAATMMFYVYLGFCGYLWLEAKQPESKNSLKPQRISRPLLSTAIFGVSLLVMLYVIYATNLTGWSIAKNLNYGRLAIAKDPKVAKAYFDRAESIPFNVYTPEASFEYSNLAIALVGDENIKADRDLTQEALESAVNLQENTVRRFPKFTKQWLKLANLYFSKDDFEQLDPDQKVIEAAGKAIALAPARIEAKLFLVNVYMRLERKQEAEELLGEVLAAVPQKLDARWALATIYYYTDRKQQGVQMAEEVLSKDYVPNPLPKIDWLLDYYYQQNNPTRVVEILQTVLRQVNSAEVYARLGLAYKKIGDKEKAAQAAEMVRRLEPQSSEAVDQFLESLN